ncbi:hypothetical protein ALP8811_02378 [Aliiroseovarius pelagivivens]|uniref:Uncharacterized protein n=1 Tax=Aliiroseovarius pelagivivens TaxID=1639690 RepID=A0A2R8AMT6_9RHOB|nr:hypothetical protein [Aliiroseovarius pelagivivens]SPF77351.1 hypothetical protein ALP8811_02378 [Aliiroseovarius pelagivivens]
MSQVQIRFDVPRHYVSVDAFVASAKATQRTLNALNQELFDNRLDLELVVFAPEAGSVRQILKVVVKGAAYTYGFLWSIVQVLETDLAKDVTKELTGKYPSELVSEIARDYKMKLAAANSERERKEIEAEAVEIMCSQVSGVLADASASALVASRRTLEKLPMSDQAKFELIDSQAELFEKAISDQSISAIEIEERDLTPVTRNAFPERAIRPRRPKTEPEDIKRWRVATDTFTVTSPQLEEEDQKARKWKGKNSADKVVLFTVDDKEFWYRFHRGEISFGENTTLTVQAATLVVDGKVRSTTVLRVLSFEGQKLAEPIDESGLKAILGSLDEQASASDSRSLFD